jgi:broad specificity phosphatase PhoE
MSLIFVRHGETSHNENGKEKLRGWLPVPLTLEGMKHTDELGKFLAKVTKGVKVLYTSDLVRAVQSANELAEALELELTPLFDLRDWNTGDLAGSAITPDLISHLQGLIKADKPAPNGERYYSDFVKRIRPILERSVKSNATEIILSHGRVSTLVHAISKTGGKEPDLDTVLGKPPIDPCGFMILGKDWKIHYMTPKEKGSARTS